MALDLDATSQTLPEILAVADLTPADLQAMEDFGPHHSLPELKKIKTAHHHIAIYLAKGLKLADVARLTGYAVTTISNLKANRAFTELLRHYELENEKTLLSLQTRTEVAAHQLLDELQERLDDMEAAAKIPFGVLADTLTKVLDRAGQGPMKKSESKHVTIHLTAEEISRIRAAAESYAFGVSTDRRSGMGEDCSDRPVARLEARYEPSAEDGSEV